MAAKRSLSQDTARRRYVRYYDGCNRSTIAWDGLRRDDTLWFEDGDCLVHFYSIGASQRGHGLRLRFSDVEALRSDYLLRRCLHCRDISSPVGSDDGASDSGYASSRASKLDVTQNELYIPAPASLTREQAYSYHLTTRNFFAYATSRPVVGEKLGTALADLLERVREWQPKTAALANFMSYCQRQGYFNMAANADHALACLLLAEHAHLKDLWVEAFVHCVGMHEKLDLSPEFVGLSNTTKALITRASLEMDLHVTRVVRALGTFLEEELGQGNLGLSKPARDHLDRFRSCLHNYYVDKLGYFPPNEEGPWSKRLWTKMYHSFQSLYEYLVDTESSTDPTSALGFTGGVCVLQNVQAYDQRHGYTPLPHPLPLLPELPTKRVADGQKGLRSFKLGRVDSGVDQRTTAKQALLDATNSHNEEVLACPLVQEYRRFERQKLEEKLTLAEARKVRWLLVYSVLQMLISITRAPKEVRDTDTPTYPMCVLTTGCPYWEQAGMESPPAEVETPHVSNNLMLPQQDHDAMSERISIHPDCEAETAEDYFASHTITRQNSQLSLNMTPSPLRITTQISRTASIRSSVHALHRSFVGSLNRRSSVRKATGTASSPVSKSNSFCEILVEGYGNGTEEHGDNPHGLLSFEESAITPSNALAAFDFGLANLTEEPMLEDYQLEVPVDAAYPRYSENHLHISYSESDMSVMTSNISGSARSSTIMEYDSPATDVSSDGYDSKRNSDMVLASTPNQQSALTYRPSVAKRHSYQQKHLNFGVNTNCFSVNVGCYKPTGRPVDMPLSKFAHSRTHSGESLSSTVSSQYAEENMQAAEIEEEQMRGRRRSRGLDRLSESAMTAAGRTFCIPE